MTRLDTLEDVYITNNKDVLMELLDESLDESGHILTMPRGTRFKVNDYNFISQNIEVIVESCTSFIFERYGILKLVDGTYEFLRS